MKIKSFIFEENGKIATALKFSVLTFTLELVFSAFLLLNISIVSRFTGLLNAETWPVVLIVFFFYLRVLGLHLVLGIVVRFFDFQFSVKHKKSLCFLVFIYSNLFIAVKYPQIFDEFPVVSEGLKLVGLFNFPWVIYSPGILILILLGYSYLKVQKMNYLQFLAKTLGLLLLGYYFFSIQSLSIPIRMPEAKIAVKPTKPHVILITVDSLQGDFSLETRSGVSTELADYLATSVKFKRVVSPLPQTHSALVSLLTAKTPPFTGVRNNLSSEALDGEKLLKNSPLAQFNSAGYKIKIMRDNSEYAFFDSKSLFEKNRSPDYSIANVIISTFFKNRIVFGLFNNLVGRIFLPEMDQNAAFNFSYDVSSFTNTVLTELDSVSQQSEPHFIFVHTCSLHWPGAFPYPYYPQTQIPERSFAPFAYTSKFYGLSQSNLSSKDWQAQVDFNRRIYQSGVQLTIDEFLNPIFAELHSSGLDQNSIIVLLSDHGEDIWAPESEFPKAKPVQHGASLLFGATSELSYLRIKAPDLKPAFVSNTIGMIDLLPTVLGLSGIKSDKYEGRDISNEIRTEMKSESYYTETGLWPFPSFAGQFISTPSTELGSLFKLEISGFHIYIDPDKEPGIIQQKQRAIIKGNLRFTLFPTNYGYSEFLCDLENDKDCHSNKLLGSPNLGIEFREKMKFYIREDVDRLKLKTGPCSRYLNKEVEFDLQDIGKYQWNYFYQAVECANTYHSYEYANSIFDRLVIDLNTSDNLKSRIKEFSLRLCGLALVYKGGHLPKHLVDHFNSIPNNGKALESIDSPIDSARCLMAMEDQARLDVVLKFLSLKKNRSRYYLGSQSPSVGIDLQRISNFENIINSKKNGLPEFRKKLEDFLQTEMNYNFIEEMEPFLLRAIENIGKLESSERLFELLERLSKPENLSVTVFNSILWEIDQLLIPGTQTGQLSSMRVTLGSDLDIKALPTNLKDREVEVALKLGEKFLCEKKHPLCKSAKKLVYGFQFKKEG